MTYGIEPSKKHPLSEEMEVSTDHSHHAEVGIDSDVDDQLLLDNDDEGQRDNMNISVDVTNSS